MDKKKTAQTPLAENPNVSQKSEDTNPIFTKNLLIFIVVAIVMGGMIGFILSDRKSSGNTLTSGTVDPSKITKGTIQIIH